MDEIVSAFAAVPVYKKDKVRVGIVGEIYVKFAPLGNNNLEAFLLKENAEPVVPGLLDFPRPHTWLGRQPKGCVQTILLTPSSIRAIISPVNSHSDDDSGMQGSAAVGQLLLGVMGHDMVKEDSEHITLFFHSAGEGHKLDLLRKDNNVAFEMDAAHELFSHGSDACGYGMRYQCVMGAGTARLVTEDGEKAAAFDHIMAHYTQEPLVVCPTMCVAVG